MKNDYIFSNELIIGLYGNPISYYFLQSLSLSEHKYSRIQSCTMTLGNITCVKLSKVYCKGASIYDVRTEGGGVVSPKEYVVRVIA